jgi:hypothetical protein
MKPTITIIFILAIESLFIYFLWNMLMPKLFNLEVINFMQAIGIRILASSIFGRYHGSTD